ncbi:leucine repeat adapter protein 25-like [Argiope bruennichi]|uniref:Leucine repeat adapter protein 25 like protein n=1 Tax=Argiope bruennichi TaxID=94029 RepID=A0A8T0FSV6_ARGBR|nr:leucine repeat adapter protein 25-like [Argiope bruennichi]XP_055931326.1 leucine repeat adapter protein 25-like [Argiope bruennichi]KAF8793846.1 Leucine repeat adapter protein 25 like protein [Argiope bruennichi]
MASLQGLPPLPKSLSGLLNFSSAQWKEMERLHTMRTMIQQDLSRGLAERTNLQRLPSHSDSSENIQGDNGGLSADTSAQNRAGRLDVQLALLRKEMVGLRQLDMSLLCQLWSLNESIHEYKQLLQDRMSLSLSPTHASSPGWDNGIDSPSSEEHGDVNNKSYKTETNSLTLDGSNQTTIARKLSSVDSTSHSSLEFGDI